jgi:hypothetical protein
VDGGQCHFRYFASFAIIKCPKTVPPQLLIMWNFTKGLGRYFWGVRVATLSSTCI